MTYIKQFISRQVGGKDVSNRSLSIFEPKNVGSCLCVPMVQQRQWLSLESLRGPGFQDMIKRFSIDLRVLLVHSLSWKALERNGTYAEIAQVISDILALF